MTDAEKHAALFAGRWIGETQGYDAPAHVWEISSQGSRLTIETRWEDQTRGTRLSGQALADEPAFEINDKKAVLIGSQHFLIRGWDTNDTRSDEGPDYDVVFARPGIAELQTHDAWVKYNAEHPDTTTATSDGENGT